MGDETQGALQTHWTSAMRAAFRVDPADATRTILAVLATIDPDALTVLLAENTKETIIGIGSGEGGTKKEHTFQEKTKQFIMRVGKEKSAVIEYSFNETRYDADNRLTITKGGFLKLSGTQFPAGKKIYFNCSRDNVDVEILELY